MSDEAPRAAAWRVPVGPVTCLAAAWWLAFIGWQFLGWGGAANRTAIGDLAPLPLEIAAVVLAARAALRVKADRRMCTAWVLVATSFALYLAGDMIWAIFEVVLDESPYPSIADVAYLAFYPAMLVGLLWFPISGRSRAENFRLMLDVGIVVLSGGMAVWYFVIGPAVHDAATIDLETALSIAYPVGDLVLILGLATVLLRGVPTAAGWPLRMLLVGLVSFVIADVGFGHLSLLDAYESGDWPDTFWILSIVAFVAAGEQQRSTAAPGPVAAPAKQTTLRISVLPYLAIAGAYGLLLMVSRTTAQFPLDGLLLGAFVLTSIVVARQLTALRDNVRLVEEFRRLASTDSLTGLLSRRHFHELAQHELLRARAEHRPLSAIMVDLDNFKAINDSFGHGVGDEALRWVANRIEVLSPADALAARYGGDELVVLLPGAELDNALQFAERLADHIAAVDMPVPGGPEMLSLSLGVASAAGCADVETLLRCADAALYEAKRAGRNCARAHPEYDIPSSPRTDGSAVRSVSRR